MCRRFLAVPVVFAAVALGFVPGLAPRVDAAMDQQFVAALGDEQAAGSLLTLNVENTIGILLGDRDYRALKKRTSTHSKRG